jgi:D-arabinose 1-dehydrogenase-like Zn-dependent alcohol dehydrogenase
MPVSYLADPPKTYTAYAFTKVGGDLEPITVQWKDPKQDEVVLKVIACGVCASDENVKEGNFGIQLPRVPGHEIVGEIYAIPESENHYKLGQRVGSGWHGGHCHVCKSCRKGDFNICEKGEINGITKDGGYAQFVTLNRHALAVVPESLDSAEAAPLVCAGITAFNSIRNMNVTHGDLVAIQGIGGIGHLAIQFSRKMGFRTAALSSGSAKKDLALQLGADYYIDGSKEDQAQALAALGGAKVIAASAPNPEIIANLLPGLGVDGQLVILALAPPATIPLGALITKRLSIVGWPAGKASDSEDTMNFAAHTGVKTWVTTFPLEKANEAYNHRASARFRAVIVP